MPNGFRRSPTIGNSMSIVSPDEILNAAKAQMLDGREPESKDDWALIVNFIAHNIAPEIALNGCLLMRTIYEMPLSDYDVTEIVKFQQETSN
jgi:hypothetical protein